VTQKESGETEILDVLWQSLSGGNYDLDAMKSRLNLDSRFDEFGIDSLDMTDFFIRIEDVYKIKIRQEDYAHFESVRNLQEYLQKSNGN